MKKSAFASLSALGLLVGCSGSGAVDNHDIVNTANGGAGSSGAAGSSVAAAGAQAGAGTSGAAAAGGSGETAMAGAAGSGASAGRNDGSGGAGGPAGGQSSGGAAQAGNGGALGVGGAQQAAGAGGTAGAPSTSGVPFDPTQLAKCTGSKPITCAIAEPNGNYDVHVELGSPIATANSRVLAETYRIEQPQMTTAMNAFAQQTFTVNVRQEVHDGYGAVGGILNLMIDGTAPALHALGIVPAPKAITLFLVGDSTMCDWDPTAMNGGMLVASDVTERGWGQELSQYIAQGVAVADYADSGETAGSFYSKFWPPAKAAMKAGDYLLMQFGHNDQKSTADIANYAANLTKYITDARAKNVTPVILTPVARSTGVSFAGLDQQARDLAASQHVALIDLSNLSNDYYKTVPDKNALFFAGQGTHFNESGATQVAGVVAKAIKASTLGLAPFMR